MFGLFLLVIACWTAPFSDVRAQSAEPLGDPAAGRRAAQEHSCGDCHGLLAKNPPPNVPWIDGQKKAYLLRQMTAFRETRRATPGPLKTIERRHPKMDFWLQALTDEQVVNLAEYFGSLPCAPRRTFAAADVPRPALLPRCLFCHGDRGVTPYIGYPNIGGQDKGYLVKQLKAFRSSANHGTVEISKIKDERFHRFMEPSVYDLTDREIEDVADYFSKQSCQ
jgi:cytochrome c553